MKKFIEKLANFESLTAHEMTDIVENIVNGNVSESQITALLLGLKMKGETVEERTALAQVMKKHAQQIPTTITNAMDNCGTGGDQSFSFNVSTTAAFVLAGGGVQMAKHGNRSISSKSGSADVLEYLGINLDLSPIQLGEVLEKAGIVFLFAKNMHPAMKYIMPARLSLGIPTVMNLTGPLIHPMNLETQLIGISRPELLESMAEVLKNMGRKRAVIVSGPDGLDEAGLHGESNIAILENNQIRLEQFTPEDIGMERISLEDIRGGDAQENASILVSVLENQASPYLEMTVLNAGLGFYANGKVTNVKDGILLSRQIIASGAAYDKLKLLQEYQK
ncbi:MAG: anthranilate phosphoribosyltransferase [Streptococcus sp.]|nr:anthranilate phosphoribosyltransferase [Streptococcus sp.]